MGIQGLTGFLLYNAKISNKLLENIKNDTYSDLYFDFQSFVYNILNYIENLYNLSYRLVINYNYNNEKLINMDELNPHYDNLKKY